MKLLLDTHTFIWWQQDNTKLSAKALAAIRHPENTVYLSVINAWEMQIKHQLGKLTVHKPITEMVDYEVNENGFQILPVLLDHVYMLDELPLHHKDPFDRLLIAQAKKEGLTLVSDDTPMRAYNVTLLW